MYDELTNIDFICLLHEKAHSEDQPSADHANLMDEAAHRIRKLETRLRAWEWVARDSASIETPEELEEALQKNSVRLDDLCSKMLQFAAFGGEVGGTNNMTGDQIKEALAPFFSQKTISRCVNAVTRKGDL